MINKNILCKKIIIFMLLFFSLNCGFVKKDYYSKPANNFKNTGFLLRGSGWKDQKYGYAVNNVNQYENSDLIVAVRIDNFFSSYWAFGPFYFTIIPTFGLIKEYSQNGDLVTTDDYRENNTRVTILIFFKKEKKIRINFCSIVLISDEKKIYTEKYFITYMDRINERCECKNYEIKKEQEQIQNYTYDAVLVNLDFKTAFTPDKKGKIIFPIINDGNLKIVLPDFKFEQGSGFIWGSVL